MNSKVRQGRVLSVLLMQFHAKIKPFCIEECYIRLHAVVQSLKKGIFMKNSYWKLFRGFYVDSGVIRRNKRSKFLTHFDWLL